MTKILVVEDEDDIRLELMEWLQFEGYEVVGAANGKLGLEAIYRELPEMIICDIAMPEMDGREVLMELRSDPNFVQVPFIFLTASVDHASIRRGMNLGADDYLTKPFTHAEILEAVRSRLDKKIAQDLKTQAQLDFLLGAVAEAQEKQRLKSRLVAMFSHEFRNPLSSVLLSSNILRKYEGQLTPERKTQHLDRIDSSIHLLIQMLDDMLLVAELEGGHLEFHPTLLALNNFMEDIIDEIAIIDQNAHVLILHNRMDTAVYLDPKLMRQILANLITNAIKYSPPKSKITITVERRGDRLHLSVQDQGIGIPEESLPHIFEAFHRAANAHAIKGTGLGLSIVKDCVERHQGQISVTSQIQKGTTFMVDLPLISEQ